MTTIRRRQPSIPFYRDERVLAWIIQVVVLLLAVGALWLLVQSTLADLEERNLAPGLDFLDQVAGFGIGEGADFDPSTDSYLDAFRVGLGNTLRVAVLGVVLATLLGFVIALGRLSGNPLLERLCVGYIELFRNTPLLVQLIFWYQGVVLRLPGLSDSLAIWRWPAQAEQPDRALAFLSQRGLALPDAAASESARAWWAILLVAIVLAYIAGRWREAVQARTGRPARTWLWGSGLFFGITISAWLALPAPPYRFGPAEMGRFSYASGSVFSPEFTALLLGLVVYSAAFIAEVIRGGILSISTGQREAARALGLREGQVMRLVVLPQALKVIVPPLTSQYLNLTKNSTLAIYIGFPDLFNVSLTIGNNTGQFVVVTAMIMAVYLALSLITSLTMNLYNRRVQVVER